MRLIDADELRIIPGSAFDVMPVCDISSAPTVEAIPVEWIEKWLAKRDPYDDCVRDMLCDWRKENELGTC